MTAFYLTTPIYYVNDRPHLGHAYSTIVADAMTRYHRVAGDDVWFLTGTDEHGDKIAQAAAKAGVTPQAMADQNSAAFRATWQALGIQNSDYIRTTETRHKTVVQAILQKLWNAGEIYLGKYGGNYCFGCERFYTEKEIVDGKCPDHLTPLTWIEEENYFFKMSKYQSWLIEQIERHPDFVRPERYRNEVLAMLRDPGFGDFCISRPRERLSWGIPLPFDDRFVAYVWADALVTYLTAIGYPSDPEWKTRWLGVHHLLAKEILKFHGATWPIILHAAGLPLFRGLRVHGYWTLGGAKISKSAANLTDALGLKDVYGFEALRYFMLREMSFGLDAEFSEESLVRRINADLANDLGNLLSRSLSMVARYFDGVVPKAESRSPLADVAARVAGGVDRHVREFSTQRALASLWELVSSGNKHIDSEAPWQLAKDPAQRGRLASVLYGTLESLRVIAVLLSPFMPETSAKILAQIGSAAPPAPLERALAWGQLAAGAKIAKGEVLFPRIETP